VVTSPTPRLFSLSFLVEAGFSYLALGIDDLDWRQRFEAEAKKKLVNILWKKLAALDHIPVVSICFRNSL
jgi:hypothetical protein